MGWGGPPDDMPWPIAVAIGIWFGILAPIASFFGLGTRPFVAQARADQQGVVARIRAELA